MKSLSHLPNARSLGPHLLVCAQPDPGHWEEVRAAGAAQVINLCEENEYPYDEAAAVTQAGMDFIRIPVSVPDGVNLENARQLHEAMLAGPSLIHCSTGNRAAALLALRAYHLEDEDIDQALAKGRAAGLTKLEELVRQRLS